jgi:hypothetical protein
LAATWWFWPVPSPQASDLLHEWHTARAVGSAQDRNFTNYIRIFFAHKLASSGTQRYGFFKGAQIQTFWNSDCSGCPTAGDSGDDRYVG